MDLSTSDRHTGGMDTLQCQVLSDELRRIVPARPDAILSDIAPELEQIAAQYLSKEAPLSVLDVQPLFDDALGEIAHEQAKEAARCLLEGGESRFRPLKIRGAEAGIAWGNVTYGAFRRRGSGGMEYVLSLCARAILEICEKQSDVIGGTPTSSLEPIVSSDPGDRKDSGARDNWLRRGVVIAVVGMMLGATVMAQPWKRNDQRLAGIEDGANPAVPECVPPGSGDIGSLSSPIAKQIEELLPLQLCGHSEAEWRGSVVFQELKSRGQIWGGVLAWVDEIGAEHVQILELGPWQSYLRIGGGNGSRSPLLGGLPVGDPVEENGAWRIFLDGGAELHGEARNGTYYWLPSIAAAKWQAEGGPEGWLGRPTSSPYWRNGFLSVDFEGGTIRQLSDGSLSAIPPEISPSSELGPADKIVGTVITAADGTSWVVDGSGGRWWVSSGGSWMCSNAEDLTSLTNLSGSAIHLLPYKGHVTCPVIVEGFPNQGGVNIALFCHDQMNLVATEVDGPEPGWRCGYSGPPLDPKDVCLWQYGSSVRPLVQGDRYNWRCAR